MDEETLKDLSFAKGKVLIATEEPSRIDRWIQMEVHGVRYDVLVQEEASCVHPDEISKEVKPPQNSGEVIEKIEFLQMKGGKGSVMARGEVEDDDVESYCPKPTNERRG